MWRARRDSHARLLTASKPRVPFRGLVVTYKFCTHFCVQKFITCSMALCTGWLGLSHVTVLKPGCQEGLAQAATPGVQLRSAARSQLPAHPGRAHHQRSFSAMPGAFCVEQDPAPCRGAQGPLSSCMTSMGPSPWPLQGLGAWAARS